jgi:hypothetical protein
MNRYPRFKTQYAHIHSFQLVPEIMDGSLCAQNFNKSNAPVVSVMKVRKQILIPVLLSFSFLYPIKFVFLVFDIAALMLVASPTVLEKQILNV